MCCKVFASFAVVNIYYTLSLILALSHRCSISCHSTPSLLTLYCACWRMFRAISMKHVQFPERRRCRPMRQHQHQAVRNVNRRGSRTCHAPVLRYAMTTMRNEDDADDDDAVCVHTNPHESGLRLRCTSPSGATQPASSSGGSRNITDKYLHINNDRTHMHTRKHARTHALI